MKLNTRARYALRAMIQIARSGQDGKPINLNDISAKTSVTRRYLEQLVIPLKNASLLKGMSGKEGGYLLARAPEKIKVGDIVQAAIGPINIVHCVKDTDSCMKVEWCECRPLYVLLNQRIEEAFNAFTLADLAGHKIGQVIAKEMRESNKAGKGEKGKKRKGTAQGAEFRVPSCEPRVKKDEWQKSQDECT
ncbi:Rrf2 family transcriptional regulator [Candidatus Poribacteria bacterium]|nr:Rrf2 family transcriptional regulator [Candidatus Poribacteria bacterium]